MLRSYAKAGIIPMTLVNRKRNSEAHFFLNESKLDMQSSICFWPISSPALDLLSLLPDLSDWDENATFVVLTYGTKADLKI